MKSFPSELDRSSPADRGYLRRDQIVAELRAWADDIEQCKGEVVVGAASPDWFKIDANFYFEYDAPPNKETK